MFAEYIHVSIVGQPHWHGYSEYRHVLRFSSLPVPFQPNRRRCSWGKRHLLDLHNTPFLCMPFKNLGMYFLIKKNYHIILNEVLSNVSVESSSKFWTATICIDCEYFKAWKKYFKTLEKGPQRVFASWFPRLMHHCFASVLKTLCFIEKFYLLSNWDQNVPRVLVWLLRNN